jgi:LPS O-antigen subunit length determinant protein (WzzB/FepE family)
MNNLQPQTNLSVYEPGELAPQQAVPIGKLFVAVWRARMLTLFLTLVFILAAFLYVLFLRQPTYMATATIGPVTQTLGAANRGGIAALAGFGIGGDSDQFNKYRELLDSTRLAARLERDHGVMRHLIPGWDEATHSWQPPSDIVGTIKLAIRAMLGMPAWTPPTPASLSAILQMKLKVNSTSSAIELLERRDQIYTVNYESDDREYAIQLLAWILKDADTLVREDQLTTTANRIAYLKKEMDRTPEIYVRDTLQQILVDQENSMMTLQVDRYYAVDMIDPPNADTKPTGPSATSLLLGSAFGGIVLSLLIIYVLFRRRMMAARANGSDPLAEPFPNPFQWIGALARRYRRSGSED